MIMRKFKSVIIATNSDSVISHFFTHLPGTTHRQCGERVKSYASDPCCPFNCSIGQPIFLDVCTERFVDS